MAKDTPHEQISETSFRREFRNFLAKPDIKEAFEKAAAKEGVPVEKIIQETEQFCFQFLGQAHRPGIREFFSNLGGNPDEMPKA
jgi:hypothetical protein